jgi:acetyl esterase/lipase
MVKKGLSILVIFLLISFSAEAEMTEEQTDFEAERQARRAEMASRPRPELKREPDRELVYKKTAQGELKVYIYFPEGWKETDQRPGILFFHGGGFSGGSPSQFFVKAEYLASRGLVALSAQYRIKNKHGTSPVEAAEDARSAMRYVRSHAAEFGIDPKRIISGGGSAGGHLAACVALCEGPDAPDDDLSVSCKPQAMVLFNPVLNFGTERILSRFKEGDEAKVPLLLSISPIEFLKEGCPPAIVFFGTADWLLGQGRDFVEKSLALGNRIELWTAEGQPHAFFNSSPWHEATTIKADEFLTSLGYLSGPPILKPYDEKAVLKKELP